MHRHFEELITECNSRLAYMGSLAERMVELALRSLLYDLATAQKEVFRLEDEVNDLHIEIDERVIEALALQHPVAADLRLLVMASKIAGELERIGDQAVNICQYGSPLLHNPPVDLTRTLSPMANLVGKMLHRSLRSFASRETEAAQMVLDSDDQVDHSKDVIFYTQVRHMMSEPTAVPQAMALVLVSRSLERVADHATNIAEEVIYAAQGREVRHHHEEKRRCEGTDSRAQET